MIQRPSSSKPSKANSDQNLQLIKDKAKHRPASPGAKLYSGVRSSLKIQGKQRSASPSQNQTSATGQTSTSLVAHKHAYGSQQVPTASSGSRFGQGPTMNAAKKHHLSQPYMRGYSPSKAKWRH